MRGLSGSQVGWPSLVNFSANALADQRFEFIRRDLLGGPQITGLSYPRHHALDKPVIAVTDQTAPFTYSAADGFFRL